MKTKIVYVVASLDDDIYMEQAIVSAWSARHYNPDCRIEMVCDQDTFATLHTGNRHHYVKELFNEIIVQQLPDSYSMIERSRALKTMVRNIVTGDFLYLDTDTIVCKDLSFVDQFPFDLGFVHDHNCSFASYIFRDLVIERMQTVFGIDVSEETEYYNSGVSFVRDTPQNHTIFGLWHRYWEYAVQNFNYYKDQQPLFKANIDMEHCIHTMPGEMNHQALVNVNHLSDAAIIHFFTGLAGISPSISPFYNKQTFIDVKNNGISEELKIQIINVKTTFASPVYLLTGEQAKMWRMVCANNMKQVSDSHSMHLLMSVSHHAPWLYSTLEGISSCMIRLLRNLKKIWKTQKHT